MGAEYFTQNARGETAQKAYETARDQALFEHGHMGYTGSLAEKDGFTLLTLPPEFRGRPYDFIEHLEATSHPLINDKWGPACCVQIGPEQYTFFGYASS